MAADTNALPVAGKSGHLPRADAAARAWPKLMEESQHERDR
jgi:hypothetical protein